MAACGTCGTVYGDSEFAECPACRTVCPKCGTRYNSDQLTMCPECRAVDVGEVEFPRWMQEAAADHNRRAVRARWTLAIVVIAIIVVAIWIFS
jgi:uncharacterized membrane protein YvbJ